MPEEFINKRFGMLTVIEEGARIGSGRHSYKTWRCICECGNIKDIKNSHLKGGFSTSCGCVHYKHGLSATAEYKAWSHMRSRCLNPKDLRYMEYGGRGIKICDKWINDAAAFVSDMGLKPSTNHSLDRIDNNLDYCPENCRWATREEQMNNTQRTIKYTLGDDTFSAAQWSRLAGHLENTVTRRINVNNMSFLEAVFTDCSNTFLEKYPLPEGFNRGK